MEENKGSINNECEKCKDGKGGMCCGHGHMCHGKCHMMKILITILILAAVFCLGTMVGSHRNNFRDYGERGGFMMNGNYGPRGGANNVGTGSTTIQVLPLTGTTPVTPAQ
jgi:hypothetical protein